MLYYTETPLYLTATILGADNTGKTSLFLSLLQHRPRKFYEDITLNHQDIYIDKYTTLRLLDYTQLAKQFRHYITKNTILFLLVFNINDRESFTYLKKEIETIHKKIAEQELDETNYSFILVANRKPITKTCVTPTTVSEIEITELSQQLHCKYFTKTMTDFETLQDVRTESVKIAKNQANKIRDSLLQKRQAIKKEWQAKRKAEIKSKIKPYAHFILNLIINIVLIALSIFTLGWCLYRKYQGKETVYEENYRQRGKYYKFWGDTINKPRPDDRLYLAEYGF